MGMTLRYVSPADLAACFRRLKTTAQSPALDYASWMRYFRLCEDNGVSNAGTLVVYDPDNPHGYFVPMTVAQGCAQVLTADVCGGLVPATQTFYEQALTHVADSLGLTVLPPSCKFIGGFGSHNASYLATPVVDLTGGYDAYLDSLGARRRYDVKRLAKLGYTVSVSGDYSLDQLLDWCRSHWPDPVEYDYAIRQLLFARACTNATVVQVRSGDRLIAVATSIAEYDGVSWSTLFSAFASDRSQGVGAFAVQALIREAAARGCPVFDPAAVTSYSDLDTAYSVYKRMCGNAESVIAQYYVAGSGCDRPSCVPPFYHDATWVHVPAD